MDHRRKALRVPVSWSHRHELTPVRVLQRVLRPQCGGQFHYMGPYRSGNVRVVSRASIRQPVAGTSQAYLHIELHIETSRV